jgi:hypothetical protein
MVPLTCRTVPLDLYGNQLPRAAARRGGAALAGKTHAHEGSASSCCWWSMASAERCRAVYRLLFRASTVVVRMDRRTTLGATCSRDAERLLQL